MFYTIVHIVLIVFIVILPLKKNKETIIKNSEMNIFVRGLLLGKISRSETFESKSIISKALYIAKCLSQKGILLSQFLL